MSAEFQILDNSIFNYVWNSMILLSRVKSQWLMLIEALSGGVIWPPVITAELTKNPPGEECDEPGELGKSWCQYPPELCLSAALERVLIRGVMNSREIVTSQRVVISAN